MLNEADLRVLMLGGRRCGKTSVLASMFDSIVNGQSNNFITTSDDTDLEIQGTETQDSLSGQISELKNLLEHNNTATFLVDKRPTKYWWNYRLKIQLRGTNEEMYINFADIPGEFCRQGNDHQSDVEEYIKQCDVFVITVDTPYLMESANSSNPLCTNGINEVINRVPDIQQYLTHIGNATGSHGKMVVFCPVKCEKWFNEGRIREVCDRINEVYSTCITNLMAYDKMDISIVPMLTAGNIEFVEQKEAFVLLEKQKDVKYCKLRNSDNTIKCCRQNSRIIRLLNGSPYVIKEGDNVNEDPEAIITGSNLIRPYSWFKVRHRENVQDNGYKPLNCEQLPLHIIRFMLNKRDYMISHPDNLFKKILNWINIAFGNIDPVQLKNIIKQMQLSGIVKDDVDSGIIHIKKAY